MATIVEAAIQAGSFRRLMKAVQAAELVDTLSGKGPYTVFAPTDEAFAKLPAGTLEELLKPESKSKLQAILTYHVVPGRWMAADVTKEASLKTVQGQSVPVRKENSTVRIGDATVTQADLVATNGVIHVIDSVMLPEA